MGRVSDAGGVRRYNHGMRRQPDTDAASVSAGPSGGSGPRTLVIGCDGLLGREFLRTLPQDAIGVDLPGMDMTSMRSIDEMLSRIKPDRVINCAAITDVDRCESDPAAAYRLHRDGVAMLAARCSSAVLVSFSTDHVYDGARAGRAVPFLEDEVTSPVNVYARSKVEGERAALALSDSLVVRTSFLFGDHRGLVPWVWSRMSRGLEVSAVTDQVSSATFVTDLVEAVLLALERGRRGILHASGPEPMSPFDIAGAVARCLGLEESLIVPVSWADIGVGARRPGYSFLSSKSDISLPSLEESLQVWRGRIE